MCRNWFVEALHIDIVACKVGKQDPVASKVWTTVPRQARLIIQEAHQKTIPPKTCSDTLLAKKMDFGEPNRIQSKMMESGDSNRTL